MDVAIDVLGRYVQWDTKKNDYADGYWPPFGIIKIVPYNDSGIYDTQWAWDYHRWELNIARQFQNVRTHLERTLRDRVYDTETKLFGGCCSNCNGTGVDVAAYESNGKCWDCYGTAHAHPRIWSCPALS